MALAFMCDRCKSMFEHRKDLKRVVYADITASNRLMNKYDMQIDLCQKCCDELFDFVKKESEDKSYE